MRINYLPGRLDEMFGGDPITVVDLTAMYEHTFPEGTGEMLIGPGLRNTHSMHAFHLAFHRVAMRALYGVDTDAACSAALRLFTLKLQAVLTGKDDVITPEKFWMGSEVQLSEQELTNLLDPKVAQEAVLYGLHIVQQIDRDTVGWKEEGYSPSMQNPLLEARNVMDFIGEFLTLPENSIWQHTRKGTYYRILGGSNQASDDQTKFPTTVIYQDAQRNTWTRPLAEFLKNFQHRYNLYNFDTRRAGREYGTPRTTPQGH